MNTIIKKLAFSVFLFMFILLSGCVNMNMRSSTASNNDATQYRKFGTTYHVLSTSKNYEERGLASWYGAGFNHRRTTSGERYNMYKLTAAHKTLPFSSHVLVTNLLNGKQVVVRVNDRGPFVRNRLIDLSYAAAKRIGMLGHGTIPVTVKAV